jgi:hypothetical protein
VTKKSPKVVNVGRCVTDRSKKRPSRYLDSKLDGAQLYSVSPEDVSSLATLPP